MRATSPGEVLGIERLLLMMSRTRAAPASTNSCQKGTTPEQSLLGVET